MSNSILQKSPSVAFILRALHEGIFSNSVIEIFLNIFNAITYMFHMIHVSLKEKLPQAFMQIRWMENYFRNLTAKIWGNMGNKIKSYMIFQSFD